MYLNSENVRGKFAHGDIYIYGAGADGKALFDEIADSVTITGFIVSRLDESDYLGYPVFAKEICLSPSVRGKIVVATLKYEDEVCRMLDEMGLASGVDYYVWDKHVQHNLDAASARLIRWNEKTWNRKSGRQGEGRILIPVDDARDCNVIYYAYLTDYLVRKYDSEIECYIRNGQKSVSDVMKKLYASFGVDRIISQELTQNQKHRVNVYFERIWNGIETFEDWKNIELYGICFGTTIIRSYLRFRELELEPRSNSFKHHLYEAIETIVFWHDRFEQCDYRMVIMWDGAHWEGFIRDIAVAKGIPTYASTYNYSAKLEHDFATCGRQHHYYKDFWNSLTKKEKDFGLQWAQKVLQDRIAGSARNDPKVMRGKDPYTAKCTGKILETSDKIKVMIAVHRVDEDNYQYGEQVFDNNYISWLVHLGDLSRKYTNYDWYIKAHPHGMQRDEELLRSFLRKYPNVKLIDKMVSPVQLKDEGLNYVFTVHGTIGSEYPLLGIQVINGGENPHDAFEFNWNPKTKTEFDDLVDDLEHRNNLENLETVYQCYAVHELFYDHSMRKGISFFEGFNNKEIGMWDMDFMMAGIKKQVGSWKFDAFLDELSNEKHQMLCDRVEEIMSRMDHWDVHIFYKRPLV